MKNSFLIIFSLVVFSLNSLAQENLSTEFNTALREELLMTEYEKDKDAEAVVIYELGENSFIRDETYGFLMRKVIKTRVKILKESGVKYADFRIPLYTDGQVDERFDLEEATVYTIENNFLRKTSFDKKNIFEEKINKNWFVKKFTLPDVKAGSVFEIHYEIITPFFFNMGEWEFQKHIPVIYSRIQYDANPFFDYVYILKGANKFDEFNTEKKHFEENFRGVKYRSIKYTFGMKDIPAFKDEEFITSERDYKMAMNFQLAKIKMPSGGERTIMSTWPQMSEDFLKHADFGKYIKSSEKAAGKILVSLNIQNLPQEEQLKVITEYIKSSYNWNGINSDMARDKVSDFMKNKTGNSANINLFLIGMLKAAKIEATPVILSTRGNGAFSKYHPFESFFNYVIAMVTIDGKQYYIDATNPMLHYTQLPEKCHNVEGFVIKPKSENFIFINQESNLRVEKTFELQPVPEESVVKTKVNYSAFDYSGYRYRSIYSNEKNNLIDLFKKEYNLDIQLAEIENYYEPEKEFIFSFSYDNAVEENDNKIFISPFGNLALSDNPFKQATRTLPVDLVHFRSEKYHSTIKIPEGYTVAHLTKNAKVGNSLLSFTYNTTQADDTIEITAEYNLKKITYSADEYAYLKNGMAIIIEKLSELIVLQKE